MGRQSKASSKREIQKILNKRVIDNSVFYFIQWKDDQVQTCSWESLVNLRDNMEYIQEYEDSICDNGKIPFEPIKKDEDSLVKIPQISAQPSNLVPRNNVITKYMKNEKNGGRKKKLKQSKIINDEEDNDFTINEDDSKMGSTKENSLIKEKDTEDSKETKIIEGKLGIDKPERILSAKRHSSELPRELICEIQWKRRKDNTRPLNSYYMSNQIKKMEPMLLLNYYEDHLVFPTCKTINNLNI